MPPRKKDSSGLGLEGSTSYHKMIHPFWMFLGRFPPNFAFNEAVPPFSKDVPATHKLEEKGILIRWGCRIKQNWLQNHIEGTWQSIWASAWTDLWQLSPPACAQLPFLGGGVLSGVVGEVAISGTALSLPSSYFQGRAKKRVFGPFSGCVMTNFWPCKDFANREQKSSFARGILSPKLCYLTLSSLLFCTNCVDVMTGYLGSNHVHDGFYYLKQ